MSANQSVLTAKPSYGHSLDNFRQPLVSNLRENLLDIRWVGDILGIVLLCVTMFSWNRRATARNPRNFRAAMLASAGVIMLASFLLSSASSEVGKRWIFPFYNVISQRVLPFPEEREWFVRQGMPMSEALMKRANKWASSDDLAFYVDPDLESFRNWAIANGKQTYIKWLLAHPIRSLTAPLSDVAGIFGSASDLYIVYGSPDFKPVFKYPYISSGKLLLLGLLVAMALSVGFHLSASSQQRLFLVPAVLLALSLPHLLVVWHGDAMEVGRHSAQVVMQVRLAVALTFVLSCDVIVSFLWRRARKKGSGE